MKMEGRKGLVRDFVTCEEERERLVSKFVKENGHVSADAEIKRGGKACELKERMCYIRILLRSEGGI